MFTENLRVISKRYGSEAPNVIFTYWEPREFQSPLPPGHTWQRYWYFWLWRREETVSLAGRTVTQLLSYDSKESFGTPYWFGRKKSATISYSPKKINLSEYLRKPVVPPYKPPRFKPLKALTSPVFRDYLDESLKKNPQLDLKHRVLVTRMTLRVRMRKLAKYNLQVQARDKVVARRKLLVEKYKAAYLQRVAKYNRRVAIYEKRLKIVQGWASKAKAVRHIRKIPEPDNPYERVKLRPIGKSLSLGYEVTRTTQNHDYLKDFFGRPVPMWWVARPHYNATGTNVRGFIAYLRNLLYKERDANLAFLSAKFYDKLGNQKVHVGNMIAERAQTISLFKSSVERLSALISGKKRLFSSALRYGKNPKLIADDFLAFKFGVQPLINDIHGAAEVLAETLRDDDETVVTIRTNTRKPINTTIANVRMEGWLEHSYVIKYSVDNDFARLTQELGLVNPAEIAWEVMPWSFVVDWFLPVGKFINQLTAETGLTFKSGTLSERFVLDVETIQPMVDNQLPIYYTPDPT